MEINEWFSILKLAKMWCFVDIHALAVGRITGQLMDPVELIILAKEHYITKWLQTGYIQLAQRPLALSVEESRRIGFPSGILVFHVREQGRYNTQLSVQTIFAKELEDMEKQYQDFISGGG